MLNTDVIGVQTRGDSFVDLELDGGPFAPGATAEAEGAPEIEVEFRGRYALGSVVGTPRADEFHWGAGGAHAGLNLNPGIAGDQDVDVTATGRFGFLVVEGRAGNDTIVSAPDEQRVPDSVYSEGGKGSDRLIAPRHTGSILEGGPGNDVIRGGAALDLLFGGSGRDDIAGAAGADDIFGGRGDDRLFGGRGRGSDSLVGGRGDDTVAGAAGADAIVGGRGHDSLSGGRGRDHIESRDGMRDRVTCGAGRDRVNADGRDQLRGCELHRRW